MRAKKKREPSRLPGVRPLKIYRHEGERVYVTLPGGGLVEITAADIREGLRDGPSVLLRVRFTPGVCVVRGEDMERPSSSPPPDRGTFPLATESRAD